MIHLSETLDIPDNLVTQPCAILARRGAGKTYTASVMTEEMLGAGLPVVVLDPLGVWFGLRSSADGEGPGLPVTILGGDHGDVPLDPTNGKQAAEIVVEEPGGWIIDLSLFESQAAQDRFAYEFADRLYRAQRRDSAPLHLMVDEAHNFVPQNVSTGRGAGGIGPKMLGAFEVLIRQGRARGIGCTLISQRPAVVNKNVLSQVEVLLAGQVTGTIDREVLTKWAEGWATPAQLKEFEGSLASLKIGEVWLWSPQWLETFQRIRIRTRHTFDSSATPKAGQRRIEPRVLAPIDLEAVKERFAATIEKVDAADPVKLQRRIREVERERDAALASPETQTVVETITVEVLPEKVPGIISDLRGALAAYDHHLEVLRSTREQFEERLTAIETSASAQPQTDRRAREASPRPAQRPVSPPQVREQKRGPESTDIKLGNMHRAVLGVLAQFPDGRTSSQLTMLTGYRYSGGFKNALGDLRSAGFMVGGNTATMVITDTGRALVDELGLLAPLPRGEALADHWVQKLGGMTGALLRVLIDQYPNEWTGPELAAMTPQPNREPYAYSGGFKNALGALRTLELAEGSNTTGVRATDEFMAEIA